MRKLAAEKPVVVWMGDVAASGGYYLASAATAVVAAPGTLTGSIGVIMARVVADGLLSRLGLRRVRFQRGSHAGLLSPTRRLLPDEKAAFEQHIQATYQLFLDRVCAGRGREEWLRPIAEGACGRGARRWPMASSTPWAPRPTPCGCWRREPA
ncbi:MAG: S49 family peptidase [bacterium]